METVLGKMSAEQYYKWRFSLSELKVKEINADKVALQHALMGKDQEIQKLRVAMFGRQVEDAKSAYSAAKEEYQQALKQLEEDLGVMVRGNLVDEVTFEIKKLEDAEI